MTAKTWLEIQDLEKNGLIEYSAKERNLPSLCPKNVFTPNNDSSGVYTFWPNRKENDGIQLYQYSDQLSYRYLQLPQTF